MRTLLEVSFTFDHVIKKKHFKFKSEVKIKPISNKKIEIEIVIFKPIIKHAFRMRLECVFNPLWICQSVSRRRPTLGPIRCLPFAFAPLPF